MPLHNKMDVARCESCDSTGIYILNMNKLFEIEVIYALKIEPTLTFQMASLTFVTLFDYFRPKQPGKKYTFYTFVKKFMDL